MTRDAVVMSFATSVGFVPGTPKLMVLLICLFRSSSPLSSGPSENWVMTWGLNSWNNPWEERREKAYWTSYEHRCTGVTHDIKEAWHTELASQMKGGEEMSNGFTNWENKKRGMLFQDRHFNLQNSVESCIWSKQLWWSGLELETSRPCGSQPGDWGLYPIWNIFSL